MYRFRHRIVRRYWPSIFIAIAVVVVGGGVGFARLYLQPHTKLVQSSAVTHYVPASDRTTIHLSKSFFTLDVPTGWKQVPPPAIAYTIYSWAGDPASQDASRRLDVYIDGVPPNFSVNRLLPVEANGNQLEVTGETSDNCVNFTDKTPTSTVSGFAPSKWGGVNFLCDVGNYERDVVAIGSTQGLNQVTLVGQTSGAHRVLLVYTDSSANADYAVFLAIVHSIQLI